MFRIGLFVIASLIAATSVNADAITTKAKRALNALGYNAGPVDGVMGAKTRRALDQAFAAAGGSWGQELDASDLAFLYDLLGSAAPLIGEVSVVRVFRHAEAFS